jgi:hypothetical protein
MTPAQQKNVLTARKLAQTRVARIIAGSPAMPKSERQSAAEQTKTMSTASEANSSSIALA